MVNSKSTKRALLTSALAILMCVAMLIGTTFAWFTDTASTGVNKIQAGNLKVKLEYATAWGTDGVPTAWADAEGKTLNFRTADGRTENILWEPGCRYQLPELRVVNDGNLALKYKVVISGIQGSAKLNEVINWTIKNDADAETTDLNTTEYHLTAKGTDNAFNVITIKGEMDKNAGNEYQNETIDGIGITVLATQDTVENDSFDNKYDTNATYLNTDAEGNILIGNANELVYFAKTVNADKENYAGKIVKLTGNIDLSGKRWIPLNTGNAGDAFTFDGQGYTISGLTASGEKNVGLFGTATAMTIKNLTVDGATVTGINHVAAIAGDALCAVIENCHVKNSIITTSVKNNDDGDKAGAIAGYLSAESNASVKNCSAESCTVKGYRDVGGIVGYANSAAVITDNKVTNCTIINDRTNNYKNYTTDAEFDVNAIVGEYNGNALDDSNTATGTTVTIERAAASNEELSAAIGDMKTGDSLTVGAGQYTLPNDAALPQGAAIAGAGMDKTNLTAPATQSGNQMTGLVVNNSGVKISNATINGNSDITSDMYCGVVDIREGGTTMENVKVVNRASFASGVVIKNGVGTGETVALKNMTFDVYYRALYIVDSANGVIEVSDSDITGSVYALNVNSNSSQDLVLKFTNSKLHGWSSYGKIKSASFENVEFSKGNSSYDYLRPYADTTLKNCTFDSEFLMGAGTTGFTITMENCTFNGVAVTAANVSSMLDQDDLTNLKGCTIVVNGETVTL